MQRRNLALASIAFALSILAATDAAAILPQRTFVASYGLDTHPCNLALPCRGFAVAVAKTAVSGDVIVLDSAGYGPVTITQSVSIIAPPGVYAGISVLSGDGITVDAPGIIVVLRGLSINGQGGLNGIRLLQAARLRIENCVISGMGDSGILHVADGAELIAIDTIVRDNSGDGVIVLAAASAILDHVRAEHNLVDGFAMLSLSSGVHATITDSHFVFNGRHGINVGTSIPASEPHILIDRSVLADNGANGFFLDKSNASAYGSLTRNAIHRNGVDGASISGSGFHAASVTLIENTIGANAANTGNGAAIRASGGNTQVLAGLNTVVNFDFPFVQENLALFGSYRNNFGSFGGSGTITTFSGQ